jgi:hypothetical protein
MMATAARCGSPERGYFPQGSIPDYEDASIAKDLGDGRRIAHIAAANLSAMRLQL